MKHKFHSRLVICGLLFGALLDSAQCQPKLKALIIDGQNNHSVWPKGTMMMKSYLEATGLFAVSVERTAFTWQGADLIGKYPLPSGAKTTALPEPKPDPNFKPAFSNYDVVISNFGWRAAPWPEETRRGLEAYVRGGGGLVIVHAANNSFGDWLEFNRMIGLGGWGDRDERSGPYVYHNSDGKLIRDTTPGKAGSHGPQHEFLITIRDTSHPITRGMPAQWLHAKDELYDRLRGPAENLQVLASTFSDAAQKGTGRHEPMMMTIDYGKGRAFHTPMGHAEDALECVGFIVTFQRGTEWAATGKVTKSGLPADFPTATKASRRKFD